MPGSAIRLARNMHRLVGEGALEAFARASAMQAQGHDIIHLEIGEPDFDTPAYIKDAGVAALARGQTHYTPAPGIPALRAAVAGYVSRTRGIPVEPQQVVVTPGSKLIAFFVMLALLEPGDEVIYQNPGFPVYEAMIDFTGATRVPLCLREERDFRLDPAELRSKISERTKLVVINSPQNPTGSVMTRADLAEVADAVRCRDICVFADEIYSRLQYGGEFASIASFPGMQEQTVILDGFSKTYAMTGWRLGYGVMPAELAEYVTRLMINSAGCTSGFIQRAGIAALEGPQDDVQRMASSYQQRRDLMVDGLNAIPGIRCRKPQGAFYVFPNIQATGLRSGELADYLLTKGGVATLPGTAFGECGEGYLRLCYATSESNIEAALERIVAALRALPGHKGEN